jgi:DNA uptake protein ComE-like DNA-binding protein
MLKTFLALTHPLRRRLQREPYYRFQSFEELQLAASWGIRIEANTASVDDWLRLPGISIHQARSLTKLTENGLFFNCIEDVAAALGLPIQQMQAWTSVLQFCYYEKPCSLEPTAIDVNTATATELLAVPAIDTFLGRAIVHYRQAGPYQDLADLQQRLRLTTQIASELLHYLKF